MSFKAAAAGLVVFLLSVSVIQGQDGWEMTYSSTEICAVKGSTVEIHCSYTYPSKLNVQDVTVETLWFTRMNGNEPLDLTTDSEYAGRVQYHCEETDCTLTITDLRESDSAVYKFMLITNQTDGRFAALPGVTLSVTALQVQVTRITVGQSYIEAELKCHSSCSPAGRLSYVWFKSGERLTKVQTASYKDLFHLGHIISCALQGYEQLPSPSVYAPKRSSVSVSPSAEIVEGSSVTLTCRSDANPAAKYTWYKENVNLKPPSEEPQLVFSSIQSSDSGWYYCTAENELGRRTSNDIIINVKYAPKLPSVSVSPSAEIVEGSSVNLTCSSDANPAAKYTWYKEDEDSPKASGQIFTITDIRAEHSGNYYCEAQNSRGRHNSTFSPIIVSRSMKSVAAGSITAIFLAIIFVLAFLFIRRKRSWKQTPEPRQRPDDNAQANMGAVYDIPPAPRQTTPSEQQDDLCYANVSFSKNQEDPLYSNVRLNQPNRHREEEEDEDDVEYSVVNFKSAGAATESIQEEPAEDSSVLYSTVLKKPRV